MMKKIKRLLKKFLILKQNPKILSHLGLSGTVILSDGSDIFENCGFDCLGGENRIFLGGSVNLTSSYFYINGENNTISIEKGCYIKNAIFWVEGDNNHIIIGEGSSINENNNFTCTEGHKLVIGKGCLFSTDINFQVGDGHAIFNERKERTNKTEDIVIGNHVWIGKRASLLKGAYVPSECVIGTGAIVTKKFDKQNCIIAGVPAKIVRENVFWSKNV